jgi:Zn ribbon nucleic-acid-binding protein
MSHDIADCPKCKMRDFVLKENGEWECLKCGYKHKMLKTESASSETKTDAMTVLIAAFVVALFIMFAIVGV